ncbi:NAD-binding protein [Paenibacillus polymyxa]
MVIGLGRFGSSLVRTLIHNGDEVLAVDIKVAYCN